MLVKYLNIFICNCIVPQVIQNANKTLICLTKDLLKFNIKWFLVFKCFCFKKITGIVMCLKILIFFFPYNRGQLQQIAYKQDLNASKWKVAFAPNMAQNRVNGIQGVGPEHAHLINYKQFDLPNQFSFVLVHP